MAKYENTGFAKKIVVLERRHQELKLKENEIFEDAKHFKGYVDTLKANGPRALAKESAELVDRDISSLKNPDINKHLAGPIAFDTTHYTGAMLDARAAIESTKTHKAEYLKLNQDVTTTYSDLYGKLLAIQKALKTLSDMLSGDTEPGHKTFDTKAMDAVNKAFTDSEIRKNPLFSEHCKTLDHKATKKHKHGPEKSTETKELVKALVDDGLKIFTDGYFDDIRSSLDDEGFIGGMNDIAKGLFGLTGLVDYTKDTSGDVVFEA